MVGGEVRSSFQNMYLPCPFAWRILAAIVSAARWDALPFSTEVNRNGGIGASST
jgi:hypothetical protein